MKKSTLLTTIALVAWGSLAAAQSSLMNSAETINRGNVKLGLNPIMLLQDGENETGLAARVGYGFTDSFDVEAQASFFDGFAYVAGDAELWLQKGKLDISASVGLHQSMPDGGPNTLGVDLGVLFSGKVATRAELYAGVELSRELPDEGDGFNRILVIPGIEYKLAEDLDLLIEGGIKLNDNTQSYISAGLSYYIR